LLVITVPLLVVYTGEDPLSVCFNTVTILFMTHVDNAFYYMYFVLPECVRTRMEEAGRVEPTDEEAAAIGNIAISIVCTKIV
jgi:hypothetical protein